MTERDYRYPLSPWALTDEVADTIIQATALGAYDYQAAEAAGIGRSTFYAWLAAADRFEVEVERYRAMTVKELRDACLELGLEATGKKADLLGRLVDGYARLLRFRDKVRQARAIARATAEGRVFEKNPEAWLKFGPGREREGAPGWTNAPGVERGAVEPDRPAAEISPADAASEIDYDRAAEIARNLEDIGYFENVVAMKRPSDEVEQDEAEPEGGAAT